MRSLQLVHLVVTVFVNAQAAPDRQQERRWEITQMLNRAAACPDLAGATSVLKDTLYSRDDLKVALSLCRGRDDRASYVLLGGNWKPAGDVARQWKHPNEWQSALTEVISSEPELVYDILRVERYGAEEATSGAATINSFSFFAGRQDRDSALVKFYLEAMREFVGKEPEPLRYPGSERIIASTESREIEILHTWLLLCGVCDRLDLVRGSSTTNWRARFCQLDDWYKTNQEYLYWDDARSCFAVDACSSRKSRTATPETRRVIPRIRPRWLEQSAHAKKPLFPRVQQ